MEVKPLDRWMALLLILVSTGSMMGSACVLLIYWASFTRGFHIEVLTNPYGDFWIVTGLMAFALIVGIVGLMIGSRSFQREEPVTT